MDSENVNEEPSSEVDSLLGDDPLDADAGDSEIDDDAPFIARRKGTTPATGR